MKNLPTEIICALITAGGTILSALIATISAKHVTQRELKKLKLQWKHERDLSSADAFTEMVMAVSRYTQSGWPRHQREALERITAMQTNAHGETASALNALYGATASGSAAEINKCLATVIRLQQAHPCGEH